MSELELQVEKRDVRGKNANRRLRTGGYVPAVVYGGGKDSVAITIDRRKVLELLRSTEGAHPIFLLSLAGSDQKRHAMLREMQVDPITGRVDHMDFQRIDITQTVRVEVPIHLVGEAYGVKNEGGLVDFVVRELLVECAAGKLPGHLEVDISKLHVGQHIEVKDIPLPEGVVAAVDQDRVIASVTAGRMAEEDEAEDEGLLEADKAEPKVVGRKSDEG